jgi:flagellar biosynthesis component FlhA
VKKWFGKFMDMPASVRISAVFLSVVLSVIVAIMAVQVPLLLVGIALLFGLFASAIRLLIYIEAGE